jgi:hypothetical protein
VDILEGGTRLREEEGEDCKKERLTFVTELQFGA